MAHIIYTYKGRVINLSALAERLASLNIRGASISNLSRVFSGRHQPRLALAIAIARLGDIPVEEMDAMLKHCAAQRKAWRYAPTFGDTRAPRDGKKDGRRKPAAKQREEDKDDSESRVTYGARDG